MRAAVWHGRRDTRVEEVADAPTPGPGEVKIKVVWVGICGTDLHEYAAGPIFMPITPHPLTGKAAPLIQGHEFSGMIEEVGPGVEGFAPGDRVTADSATWCGRCWACERREYSLCDKAAFVGLGRDGAFAEHITLPVGGVFHLPPELSLEKAAFVEPTAVALHAVRRGGMTPGESALVVGAGNIGLLTYQLLRHSGATRVFVVEPSPARAGMARQMGATVINPLETDVPAFVRERTDGEGVDLALECVGRAETVAMALQSTRTQGRVVVVGIFEEPITLHLNDLVFREREMIGMLNNGGEFPAAIQLLADGRIDPLPLVTGRIALEEVVERGLEECVVNKAANVKVLVNCNADLRDL
ncbi:MAG: 2,3-butanediol dehydrogenase [Chloroflexota bacterium]